MKTVIIVQAKIYLNKLVGKILKKFQKPIKPTLLKKCLNFFLISNGVYMSIIHNQKMLQKYQKILDKTFYNISLRERDKLSIYKIHKSAISYLTFERLN